MNSETTVALAAAVIATGSMMFGAWQAWSMRKQTAALTRQTELLRRQNELGVVTAELTFNREMVTWLQDILFRISNDPVSQKYVWGDGEANMTPQLAAQALNDVLSNTLAAVERLPDFSREEGAGWYDYVRYVMEHSVTARGEALKHPTWWSDLHPYAAEMDTKARSTVAPAEDGGTS